MKPKFSFDWSKWKNIKKSNLLIAALAGVLLLVIAVPVQDNTKDSEKQSGTEEKQVKEETGDYYANAYENSYQEEIEKQLKKVLASIDGVGRVEVMITLKDTGETVVEKDITKSEETTKEEDSQGTKRENGAYSIQEETVLVQEDQNSEPFVAKEVNPQVEGVLIVAEGGKNATVIKNISESVLALFPIEAHKIKVVKMND